MEHLEHCLTQDKREVAGPERTYGLVAKAERWAKWGTVGMRQLNPGRGPGTQHVATFLILELRLNSDSYRANRKLEERYEKENIESIAA
ncbi:hypothetical protein NDU88_002566 [Pleurodeles waltl]|uniref:Uncharacterized protein n=1 Tax=Pleurodeles waltl TaxID=8319 RepID=A0AAV7T3Z4_PLEWA|nr:hypothetical protein NDU88_002566 [Pleurodeles waltl]